MNNNPPNPPCNTDLTDVERALCISTEANPHLGDDAPVFGLTVGELRAITAMHSPATEIPSQATLAGLGDEHPIKDNSDERD